MLVSVKWLSDYVEAKEVSVENAREFADRMIMSGTSKRYRRSEQASKMCSSAASKK